MPLSLSLTGFPTSNPIPGDYVEVSFGQGEQAGDLTTKKVLIIAPKTSAGTITADTAVEGPVMDENTAITLGGAGSPLHRMVMAFLSICKTAPVYVLAPTASAGTSATATVTVATTPTGVGVASIFVCCEETSYAFTSSDTVTTIAAGLVAAFNAKTYMPCTAANVSGVITLTAKLPGPEFNTLRVRAKITSGVATTITPTASTAFSGGATATSHTTALATILASKYDYIVAFTNDTTQLTAIGTQLTTQALPTNGIRQQCIAAHSTTPAASVTLAQALNNPLISLCNQRAAEEEHYVIAAKVAAVRYLNEVPFAAFNYDFYGTKTGNIFPIKRPFSDADLFNQTELQTMLNGGVTPIQGATTGQAYIVRAITTKCLNGAQPDYRTRDVHRVTVAFKYADLALIGIAAANYQQCSDELPDGQPEPPAIVATPKRVKARLEQVLFNMRDDGLVDPSKIPTMIAGLQVGLDPGNSARMNIRTPLYAANLLHQTAHLVAESSPSV